MEYSGDLFQSQIMKQCRLNIPEGLKELMTDITREVLRAQPLNIERFIANYLSALLVTRDNITIASHICNHVCDCNYQTELLTELQELDLEENTVKTAYDIIIKYLNKEKVDEGTLISVLINKTGIDPSVCPAVLQAIRTAYLRQQTLKYTKYETSSGSDEDDIAKAASHTLGLYRETRPSDQMYRAMADKIKASYRAYGVRRDIKRKKNNTEEKLTTLKDIQQVESETISTESSLTDLLELTTNMQKNRITTVSSLSLAGSFSCLFKHKPNNTHDMAYLLELEETPEKERANIDYTVKSPRSSLLTESKIYPKAGNKTITFENISIDDTDVEPLVNKHNTDGKNESYNAQDTSDECLITANEYDHESIKSVDTVLSEANDSIVSDIDAEKVLDSEGFDDDRNYINNDDLDISEEKAISHYLNISNVKNNTEGDNHVN